MGAFNRFTNSSPRSSMNHKDSGSITGGHFTCQTRGSQPPNFRGLQNWTTLPCTVIPTRETRQKPEGFETRSRSDLAAPVRENRNIRPSRDTYVRQEAKKCGKKPVKNRWRRISHLNPGCLWKVVAKTLAILGVIWQKSGTGRNEPRQLNRTQAQSARLRLFVSWSFLSFGNNLEVEFFTGTKQLRPA